MSKTTLKPCPFCGTESVDLMETLSGIGGLDGEYYISCWCCGAEGGKENTRKEAKITWNCRYKQKGRQ